MHYLTMAVGSEKGITVWLHHGANITACAHTNFEGVAWSHLQERRLLDAGEMRLTRDV